MVKSKFYGYIGHQANSIVLVESSESFDSKPCCM